MKEGRNFAKKFGEVSLAIVRILESFRRRNLAAPVLNGDAEKSLVTSADEHLAVPVSNEGAKKILAETEVGLSSYLKKFSSLSEY